MRFKFLSKSLFDKFPDSKYLFMNILLSHHYYEPLKTSSIDIVF